MREEWKQIEAVLDEKVRPSLRAHGGELEIDHLEDGVLYIKLLGQCAGCPSADLTNETLIEHELTAALPELVQNGRGGPDCQRRAVGAGQAAAAGPSSLKVGSP